MHKLLRILMLVITVGVLNSTAQEIKPRVFFFGPSIEFGIPYRNLSSLGFAGQGEYLLSSSFGLIGEYSSINYNEQADDVLTLNLDLTVSAPALYICWHTPAQSRFEFFLAAGMGYTMMRGKIGNTSFSFTPNGKEGLFLPQAKLGIRYWASEHIAIRANLGFYRPFSFGIDYSL